MNCTLTVGVVRCASNWMASITTLALILPILRQCSGYWSRPTVPMHLHFFSIQRDCSSHHYSNDFNSPRNNSAAARAVVVDRFLLRVFFFSSCGLMLRQKSIETLAVAGGFPVIVQNVRRVLFHTSECLWYMGTNVLQLNTSLEVRLNYLRHQFTRFYTPLGRRLRGLCSPPHPQYGTVASTP